ncbi:hypothetical protein BU24DRAFT_80547 [Aaosphaeria arxii CBS 175.79]|uniref:Uncharacterized protein n=1 Tax=Aaosphaeria arxii CBS 175.79 TaxID=1450172 RepID=A0A6A5X9P3_9PLEO|nr:uncharacterized protein BU24DRAFT_80547 [Aaosphaeria arxii CBS 175.79]KAF2009671.1 hypothetical protein BU24DRAFT_80547 [Aaosphaeria arxii CBS 175.79]
MSQCVVTQSVEQFDLASPYYMLHHRVQQPANPPAQTPITQHSLDPKQNKNNNNNINDHEFSQLITNFSTLLPRELRDIIYHHLLALSPPSPWTVVENATIVSAPRPSKPLRTPFLSRLISRKTLPSWALDEMAQAFYRTNSFELSPNCPDAILTSFLREDFLGSSVVPGHHVRHLVLPVKAPRIFFDARTSHAKFFDERAAAVFDALAARVRKMVSAMEDGGERRGVKVEFVVQEFSVLPMMHTFRLLAPIVFELRERGFRAEVSRNESAWMQASGKDAGMQTVFTDLFAAGDGVEVGSRGYWEGRDGWKVGGDQDCEKHDFLAEVIQHRLDGCHSSFRDMRR